MGVYEQIMLGLRTDKSKDDDLKDRKKVFDKITKKEEENCDEKKTEIDDGDTNLEVAKECIDQLGQKISD